MCLSAVSHSGSPSCPAFLQLFPLVHRLEAHPPFLACNGGQPQWGWGIIFPCTFWFRCSGCKQPEKVITLVMASEHVLHQALF